MRWIRGKMVSYMDDHEGRGPVWLFVVNIGQGDEISMGRRGRMGADHRRPGGSTREESFVLAEEFLLHVMLAEPGYGS